MKRLLLITCMFASLTVSYAQHIDTFLKQVSENNPGILAYQRLLEARRLEAKTGLTPPDPFVTIGYMPGSTVQSGTKKLWSVNQSFSFPTRYLLEKKISRSNIILAEQEFNLGKMQTLLDANLTVLTLIFKEKSHDVLSLRKSNYDQLREAWSKMLTFGEATILDYNKITMELSSLNLEITRAEADIEMLKTRLRAMSGEQSLPEFQNYPVAATPSPETLIADKILYHPAYIIPELEYNLSLSEVRLSRTGSLPEFQVGYSSEIMPGETYSGPVAGLTIPLWSNTNRIKTSVAKADHSGAVRDAELISLNSEVMNEYSNMLALKKSIAEITAILNSNENQRLLDVALASGEISLTTYFSDLGIMYEVEDRLLYLEYEYNVSMARLLDHEILK